MTVTAPPDSIRTVIDALDIAASDSPSRIFLHYRDSKISYAEFDAVSNQVANELSSRGVESGDHVCLFLYNSLEYLYTYFALAKIGAVAVPIDTRFSGRTLSYIISHSEAETIFVDAETLESYQSIRDQLSNVTTEYFVGTSTRDHPYREFETLLAGDTTSPAETVTETDPVSLIYIQQSPTKRPNGVVLPHFSYVNSGWEGGRNLFDFTAHNRVLSTLPIYSIFTIQVGVMGTLLSQSEFVLEDRFEPTTFWDRIKTTESTAFLYLSRMLSVLYNQTTQLTNETTPARVAIGHSFGFVTDENLFRNFEDRFGVSVIEGYGVTQSASLAAFNRLDERKIGSLGKPLPSVDIRIVDENDRPVPTGKTGEIVIRPERPNSMFTQYYKNHEDTVADCRNQWIHSGDIGYMDDEGYLYFIANQANSIYRDRIAGRISSLEIESVINMLPDVRTSAVIGVENERGEEEIMAVVVPDDATVNPAAVCKHCQQQLPYLKIPRFIGIQNELPTSPTGKVRKQELRNQGFEDMWDREIGYELSR